jgi:hypothetical protein
MIPHKQVPFGTGHNFYHQILTALSENMVCL